MNLQQVEVELNRLYEALETAVDDLGDAGQAAAALDVAADVALDSELLKAEGTVPEKQARARLFASEAILAAKVSAAKERAAKANLSRIQSQLDVLRSLLSFMKV